VSFSGRIKLPEGAPNPAVGDVAGISDGDPGDGVPIVLNGSVGRDPAAEDPLELEGDGDRNMVVAGSGGDLNAEREPDV
jgi:hypothetical protein